MAIARDNSATGGNLNVTSQSFSYTVNSNTNGLLIIAIVLSTNPASTPITGATYNGVALTELSGGYNQGAAGSLNAFDIWYLLGPASGANTLTVTSSANMRRVSVLSYTGVNQSAPPDATGTGSPVNNTGSITSFSRSITPVASNVWGLMFAVNTASELITAGANTSVVVTDSDNFSWLDTNGANTGTFSMAGSVATATNFALSFFSIAPPTATVASPILVPKRSLLGVGI